LNHLVLEHLSGVKGGCPLEEAYYLKFSLFQGVEYFEPSNENMELYILDHLYTVTTGNGRTTAFFIGALIYHFSLLGSSANALCFSATLSNYCKTGNSKTEGPISWFVKIR
jgi:hypothetical protein